MKLLTDQKRGKDKDIDWCSVLKEYCIRCRCLFRGPYEKEKKKCVYDRRENAKSVDLQARLSRENEYRYRGEQASEERDLIRVDRR